MPANILSLAPKRSPDLTQQLTQQIRSYISQNYADTHPDAFTSSLRSLCQLRQSAAHLPVHVSSLASAQRYYAQLVFLATKFPAESVVPFEWSVSFPGPGGSKSQSHASWDYERASVLFSLASLYSSLGTSEGRGDSESLKRAIAYLSAAAGVLSHLQTTLGDQLRHLSPSCPDLEPALLEGLRDLMLAQAQECFWQKAVMDRLKNNTIAKLAERVSKLYAQALEQAGPAMPEDWSNHLAVKRWHFAAAAQLRKSMDDLEANRYGDELGRLKVAETMVTKALEAARRGVTDAITKDLKSLQAIIATNTQRGTKDNDLIYLEPVTTASNLPPIVAASMVKPAVPAEVADPLPLLTEKKLGAPLFAELVPYAVHLALSIYTDRKDSLVREKVAERRDELDAIAASTLQSLGLPGSLQALEQPAGLPPSLLRRHEELSSQGGLDRLHSLAADVARIAQTDADILAEADALLEQERREDAQAREAFAAHKLPRPSSEEAAAELREQGQRYRDTLRQAAASDQVVRQKLDDWEDLIGVMSRGVADLEAFVPTSAPSGAGSEQQARAVRALRRELERLDDLLDSRAACLSEAKAVAAADDIRPLVLREAARLPVVETAAFEDLFEKQLAKYTRFTQEMNATETQQQELLDRITERNDEFVQARKVDTAAKRREKALQNLDLTYAKYRELASNLVEGLEFYNSLAKLLSAYRQDVKEWHRARHIDIAALTAQFSGTSLNKPPQWGAFPGGEIRFGD